MKQLMSRNRNEGTKLQTAPQLGPHGLTLCSTHMLHDPSYILYAMHKPAEFAHNVATILTITYNTIRKFPCRKIRISAHILMWHYTRGETEDTAVTEKKNTQVTFTDTRIMRYSTANVLTFILRSLNLTR